MSWHHLHFLCTFASSQSVKKEAIWTVSNVTAGNPLQIQCVIDHGLIEPLVDILTDYHADHDLVKECIWTISNATTGGTVRCISVISTQFLFFESEVEMLE